MRAITSSARILKLAVLAGVAAGLLHPAGHAAARRRPVSRPPSLDVVPAPEIDARVAEEVGKAKGILENLNNGNLLASPYLVSAIYYHDGFLNDFPGDRNSAAPERRIIGQISNLLTPQLKARFVGLLHEARPWSAAPGARRWVVPVAYSAVSGRRSHHYAIDLFAREGAEVHTVSRGIVVLADAAWDPANLFSTTSRKGGNTVIVFDPDGDRFYRYCHLGTVQVLSGDTVTPGQAIGTVGHSGLNASRPGHGRHLHLEANDYVQGHVRAIEYRKLRTMLRQWQSGANEGSESPGRTAGAAGPSILSKR